MSSTGAARGSRARSAASSADDVERQLRRLALEHETTLAHLERIESLWSRLQREANAGGLPLDLVDVLLGEVGRLFPVVVAGVFQFRQESNNEAATEHAGRIAAARIPVALPDLELERCHPAGLEEDVHAEAERHAEAGHIALALRRGRPTVCASLGLSRCQPRVKTVVHVPLATLARARGTLLIGLERLPGDLSPHDLRLLGLLAGQTALALETAERAQELESQRARLAAEVAERTIELAERAETVERLNRELEGELGRALAMNDRLAAVDRAREGLLAAASHELRTPLSVILGSVQVIREGWSDEIPAEVHDLLGMCERNGTILLHMVSDLLDVAACRQGRVPLRPRRTLVQPLVEEVITGVSPLSRAHGVEIDHAVPADLDAHADPGRLQQILLNLVGNAIKFRAARAPRVRVDAEADGESVRLVVADNGVGIPEEKLDRIFEPFVRAEDTHGGTVPGAGLGLAICRALVEAQGGTIHAESAPGEGSRFVVKLPRSERSPAHDAR